MRQNRKRLGDLLVEAELITLDQLMEALKEQKKTKLRLGDQLAEMGLLSEHKLIEVLEMHLGIPYVDLQQIQIDQSVLEIINEDLSRRYQALPIQKKGNILRVAMSDPLDYFSIDDLRLSTGFQIEPVMARKEDVRLAISRYYGMQSSISQFMKDSLTDVDQINAEIMQQSDESPIAQIVNQILFQAIQVDASDIHIDPLEDEIKIRFRIDGVLRTERILPKHMHSVITSRIKIMSKLNIAEKRLPQDGRFQTDIEYRRVDIRVSCLPTIFGEKLVLRLLDMQQVKLGIQNLGFTNENESSFRGLIQSAYGIVLVTGPTGSGKTTTLYSALHQLNSDEVNMITIEDPIEYQMAGVNQVQVNPTIGMTFAKGLRSILRQDPNIIMVGEIRDTETLEISLRAAMTGHLVFSTLHTNDAVSSITRLIDMGTEAFLVSSSLIGVVAQRLVRKVCSTCAKPYTPTQEEKDLLSLYCLSNTALMKGEGCASCSHTGYKGRIGIHEVIAMNDSLREMIIRKESEVAYRQYLKERNHADLFADGLKKVAAGFTTLEEIYRVSVNHS